jgi:hypothetical protein
MHPCTGILDSFGPLFSCSDESHEIVLYFVFVLQVPSRDTFMHFLMDL